MIEKSQYQIPASTWMDTYVHVCTHTSTYKAFYNFSIYLLSARAVSKLEK